ncbi:hypothetical protein MMC11_006126 [Xylographa trunciseda]|nr:hypothetical protein [Xylographa trunciseda]
MKTLRLLRWSGSVLSPRTRPCVYIRPILLSSRLQSTATVLPQEEFDDNVSQPTIPPPIDLTTLPSPPPSLALQSAKLSALHARLSLPPRLPVETLARCLIDASADHHPSFNNHSLSLLGNDLLGYYTSELILCRYPRLPMTIIFAAMHAYVGPETLTSLTREWGVDSAAEPGGEVDPGLLQFKATVPGNADLAGDGTLVKDSQARTTPKPWNRGLSSLSVTGDYFGALPPRTRTDYLERPELAEQEAAALRARGVTLERACTNFVRAVMGAVYLHGGRNAAKAFFRAHFQSRALNVSQLFIFRQPTRDLSRLCAREGLVSPVARIISETGRESRTPVFVVGVFSGRDKLGEGQGGSLDEARFRAAVAALKGWYLYSPLQVRVPSEVEEGGKWEGLLIDGGEVVV